MNSTDTPKPRMLSAEELAMCIKFFRELRKWSQEQLAEISGLNVRTIQRIEQGMSSSVDTRRALCRAFEFEDIDAFNKPFSILSEEEQRAQKEKFDETHVTLTAIPLTTGKQLAQLAENCSMDLSEPAYEVDRETDEAFAALVDYFREYRDFYDLYSQAEKFDFYDEMQSRLDTLRGLGMALRCAERRVVLNFGATEGNPMPVNVSYIVGFPLGKEPDTFATPKNGGVRFN